MGKAAPQRNPLPDYWVRALEKWQRRESGFPPRVQRMAPDKLDFCSGAWQRMLNEASAEIAQEKLAAAFAEMHA